MLHPIGRTRSTVKASTLGPHTHRCGAHPHYPNHLVSWRQVPHGHRLSPRVPCRRWKVPSRPVSLSAFRIDTYPVTNRDFTAFVSATSYLTESEHFQWSFVFWAHLPPERLNELVEDTVAAAPWWCKVPGASWLHPEGAGSHIADRPDHPVVHVSWNDAAAYAARGPAIPSDRSPVGVRRSRWPRTKALPLGG